MSRLGKNTVQLTLAMVGQKALAFFYFLLLARMIGVESTGAYFLALSITTMFSVLTDFGLQPVLIREVAKEKPDWQRLVRNTLSLKLVFVIVSALLTVGFVFMMDYDPLVRSLIYVALGVMALDAVSLTMFGVLRGRQTLAYESVGMFLGQMITVVFGAAALLLHAPIVLLIVALLLGSLFNAVFSTAMVMRRAGGRELLRFEWSGSFIRPLLKTALPFALAGIFVKIYSYVDTLTIARFFSETEVGIWAVAYKLTYAFQFLPLAFVAALYPAFSDLVHRRDPDLSRVFLRAMLYMMFLATPIVFGLWAVAEPLIAISVGSEFSASAPVLSTLVFVLLFIFLDFPIGSLLNAADRQALKTTLMGFTMVLNVVGNLLLVPRMGVMGAAITANVSFAFLFFSGLYFVPRFVEMDWPRFVWKLARILFAGFLMGMFVRFASSSLTLFFTIPLGVALYLLFLFAFGMLQRRDLYLLYAKLASHR